MMQMVPLDIFEPSMCFNILGVVRIDIVACTITIAARYVSRFVALAA